MNVKHPLIQISVGVTLWLYVSVPSRVVFKEYIPPRIPEAKLDVSEPFTGIYQKSISHSQFIRAGYVASHVT